MFCTCSRSRLLWNHISLCWLLRKLVCEKASPAVCTLSRLSQIECFHFLHFSHLTSLSTGWIFEQIFRMNTLNLKELSPFLSSFKNHFLYVLRLLYNTIFPPLLSSEHFAISVSILTLFQIHGLVFALLLLHIFIPKDLNTTCSVYIMLLICSDLSFTF